jgi:hypothetical protein
VAFIVTFKVQIYIAYTTIVEVDESKFGERKYHHGHRVEGVWVIGDVEPTATCALFVTVVEDRSALSILELLTQYVAKGSIIYTYCWKGYLP